MNFKFLLKVKEKPGILFYSVSAGFDNNNNFIHLYIYN
jgi:hypothetical protein